MSNKLKIGLSVVIAALVLVIVVDHSKVLGGAASPSDVQSTNFTQLTTNALTVNTWNSATSTTAVGCVQTTATSTLTPIRFLYNTQATTTIVGTAAGVVVWGYGTCPF